MSTTLSKTLPPELLLSQKRVYSDTVGPSRTQQHFKADCDINVVVKRMLRGAPIPSIPKAYYKDLASGPQSYHDALNYIAEAQLAFSTLPSQLREKYGNDPHNWLQDSAWHNSPLDVIVPSDTNAITRASGVTSSVPQGTGVDLSSPGGSPAPSEAQVRKEGK